MPIATETQSNLNAKILKALEEKGIDHHAYEHEPSPQNGDPLRDSWHRHEL